MVLTDNDAVTMSSPPSPPPPIQNCLICNEIVEVIENSEKNRKVCEIFCRVACRYLNIRIGNFNPLERTLSVHSAINEDNYGILCGNCFPLAEAFCKIYNKFQYLEQLFHFRIKESIDKIRIQMEEGLDDHEHNDETEMENQELTREKRSRGQIDFRQKFVIRGKQKLSESVPIVQLGRQGLDLDSETAQTKNAINFLEDPSDSAEDFLQDPLGIKLEQEFDDDDEDKDSRSSGLSYWCEICDEEFSHISEFQRHRKSCDSESVEENTKVKHGDRRGRFKDSSMKTCCKFCYKSFPLLSKLRIHENTHTEAKPYKCRFCERTFAESGNRTKHERVHTGAMPFECAICGQRFRFRNLLNIHGDRKHPGEKVSSRSKSESYFKCEFCSKAFTTLEQKFTHERSHSSTSNSKVDPVTPTPTATSVTKKMKICKKANSKTKIIISFVCEICGKSYDHKSLLKTHMRSHGGPEPFQCKFCGKTFAMKGNLNQHERTHSDEKPFECAICGKKFRYNKAFKDHGTSMHPGEKFRNTENFKCSFCDLEFKQLGHKVVHEKSHRNRAAFPYECQICRRVFRRVQQLQEHQIENHGNQDNAQDGPSLQIPDDAKAKGEVKVEKSSSPEWNDEEMDAALNAALSIY